MKLKCVIVLVLVLLCLSGTEGQRNRKNNRNNKNNKKGNNNNSRNNSNNNNATPPPPPPPPPVPTVSEVSLLRAELMKLQNVILSQQLALATAAAATQAPATPAPAVTEAPKPKTKKTKPPKPSTTPMPPTTTAIPPPVAPETVADVTGLSQPPPVSADPSAGQVPAETLPGAPIEPGQAPVDPLEPQVETATKSLASSLSEIIAVLENAPAVASPGEILGAEAQNAIDPTLTQAAAPELVPVEPSTKPPKKMKTTTTTTMEPSTTTTTTTPAPPKPEPCPKVADISPCVCTQATLPELLPTLDCSRVASLGDLNRMAGRTVPGRLFKRIVLQNTPLSSLPRNAFGPHKAEEFWITNNFRLTRIDRGAFGSANPASLVLNNNALVNFPWQDLRAFSNLKYFIAYENQLSSIPDRAFSGLGPKIVDILLHNNSIQNVGEFPFSRLPALNAITLHNNLISELQSNAMHFDASPNILTLQNNFIKSVETDTFGRVAPLYTNLANNLIESLDREVWFQYLVNVAAAAGRNPGKSVAVDMTGNPILCEKCENFWLWQNKRRFERTVTGLTCIDAFSAPTFFELDRLFFRQCF